MSEPLDIEINAAYDPEADVWYVESSDVAGLRIEAATLDGLYQRLPGAIVDLLMEGDPRWGQPLRIRLNAHREGALEAA